MAGGRRAIVATKKRDGEVDKVGQDLQVQPSRDPVSLNFRVANLYPFKLIIKHIIVIPVLGPLEKQQHHTTYNGFESYITISSNTVPSSQASQSSKALTFKMSTPKRTTARHHSLEFEYKT